MLVVIVGMTDDGSRLGVAGRGRGARNRGAAHIDASRD